MKCEKSGNHTISYQSLLLSTAVLIILHILAWLKPHGTMQGVCVHRCESITCRVGRPIVTLVCLLC